jgi:hypothetical protein
MCLRAYLMAVEMNCTETGAMLRQHGNNHDQRNSAPTQQIGADKELDHDKAQTQLLLTILSENQNWNSSAAKTRTSLA